MKAYCGFRIIFSCYFCIKVYKSVNKSTKIPYKYIYNQDVIRVCACLCVFVCVHMRMCCNPSAGSGIRLTQIHGDWQSFSSTTDQKVGMESGLKSRLWTGQLMLAEYLYNYCHHIVLSWLWPITQSDTWLCDVMIASLTLYGLSACMAITVIHVWVAVKHIRFFMCCCFSLLASINHSLAFNRNMIPHWF